jgi:hypothetical protein
MNPTVIFWKPVLTIAIAATGLRVAVKAEKPAPHVRVIEAPRTKAA